MRSGGCRGSGSRRPRGRATSRSTIREGVVERLLADRRTEAPIETDPAGGGPARAAGCWPAGRRCPGLGLVGFCGAGFCWGYLAGGVASLDFLQPGRHTYRSLLGAGGRRRRSGLDELVPATPRACTGPDRPRSLGHGRAAPDRRSGCSGPSLIGFAPRAISGPGSRSCRAGPRRGCSGSSIASAATSSPASGCSTRRAGRICPGPGSVQRGRFSGLFPERTGVELIGGPYLHAALTTNFTQFGEGKLFGQADWDRDCFVRYARLYRPSAILCWSPHARRFCRANPDLIQILDDDGTLLIGRVVGFGGDAIRGQAKVEAEPGPASGPRHVPRTLTDRSCCGITPSRVSRPVRRSHASRSSWRRIRSLSSACDHHPGCATSSWRWPSPAGREPPGPGRSTSTVRTSRRETESRERGLLQGRGMPCQRSTPDSASSAAAIGSRAGSSGRSGRRSS